MRSKVTVPKNVFVYLFALLIPFLFTYQQAKATHAMGADLRYECLGGDEYRITLSIYRDCIGSGLAAKQNIVFSSASCGIPPYILKADRSSIIELSPLCPSQQPNSSCNGGILPGVEEHRYELITTLAQQCADWNISWQLCCRNLAITNSVITNTTRIYIESFLDNLNVTCNNSPYFTTAPVPFLCEGEPFLFNNGAIDPDGDSLVFELVDPLEYVSGTPTPIAYNSNFSPTYPMATAPANTFNFDQNSGQFSFTPNNLQQGIVALIVKEYRNGVLIGSTMRDIQMVVILCNNSVPVINTPINVTGGLLNGNTFSICAGSTLDFDVVITDGDPADSLEAISSIITVLPGATFTPVGTSVNPLTYHVTWPTTLADTGNYFVSINANDNGCPIIGKSNVGYNIIVNTGQILPVQSVIICPSSTDSIQLTASTPNPGGVGTYQWTPSLGVSDSAIRNPFAYTNGGSGPFSYSVSYNEPGECPIIEPFVIEPEGTLEILTDSVLHICTGDSIQLGATFTQTGIQAPFTFTWDPPFSLTNTGISNPIAFPNTTTLYSITASTLTCDYTANVLVIVDSPPILDPINDEIICQGDSVALNPTGSNIDSSTFVWTPFSGLSDPFIQNPIAFPTNTTTYTLTVTNGCGIAAQNVTIDVKQPLSLSASGININCNGANDGSISTITYGGGGGNSFIWSPNVSTSSSAMNLAPGLYTIIVNDTANCTDTTSLIITEPPPLIVALTDTTHLDCFGDSTGSFTVAATGGIGPYEYSIDGSIFFTLNTFSGLLAGNYTLTIRDALGCTETIPNIVINQPALPLAGMVSNQVNTNCNTNLGAFTIIASGGTPGYTFSNDGGATFTPSGSYANLFPGLYSVLVRDSLGCEIVVPVEILEISDPWGRIDTVIDVSCFGGSDGQVTVSAFDGTAPYLFSLDGNPAVPAPGGGNVITFTGLSVGYHIVTLADNDACEYPVSFFVNQPDSLYGLLGYKVDVECNGDLTGSASIIAKGGTPPYQFSIDGINFSNTSTFVFLGANTYTVTIRDANNCIGSIDFDILEPPALSAVTPQVTNISCFGLFDGAVSLTANGGTSPYKYSIDGINFVNDSLFDNLQAGTYTFYAEDYYNCLDSVTVQIIEPQPVDVQIASVMDVLCFGTPSGSITLAGTGGTQPYEFSADTAQTFFTGTTLSNLAAGTYRIIMRDANGCTDETVAFLNEPTKLLGEIDVTELLCAGDSNAMATAMITGGVGPYGYDWSNGAMQQTASNLPAGNYTVLVTDANNCQISVSTEVIGPPTFEFDSTFSTDVTCFGGNDGTAGVIVVGGTSPYTFNWSSGGQSEFVDNRLAGDHIITVTDSNGCPIMDTLTIAQPPEITIEIVDQEDAFCNLNNGSVTVLASGGVPEYTYSWDTDPTQDGPLAVDLFGFPYGGPYTVFVVDSNFCEQTLEVTIASGDPAIADFEHDLGITDTLIINEKGINFNNLSQLATTYFWDFGDGGQSTDEHPTHIYKEEGVYTVTLIAYDQNFGCPDTISKTFTLLPPGAIYVPNAFTPNGDGHNDFFHPVGVGVVFMNMDIYDRWGRHLTTLYNMTEMWNGRNKNGNAVQEGVYVWVIDATINDGTKVNRAGTVTLLR